MTDVPRMGIVTPEAVLLDLPAAGIASRVAAKVVDLTCQATLLYFGVLGIATFLGESGSRAGALVFGIIWAFGCMVVAPIASEGWWNGRTPGKAIMNLRVVTLDGGPVLWRHSFLRGIAQIVDVYLPLGILPALATRRSQRFGDLMAGTFVLVERHGGLAANPIAFYAPAGWEQFVASLDVGRLRPEQYRLIRSFLLRVGELEAGARWHLAVRLADAASLRVSSPPAPGVPPELFLVCVASAYQHRNGGLPARAPAGV
jgi:uncharacterized RDD family membrane protein YckC